MGAQRSNYLEPPADGTHLETRKRPVVGPALKFHSLGANPIYRVGCFNGEFVHIFRISLALGVPDYVLFKAWVEVLLIQHAKIGGGPPRVPSPVFLIAPFHHEDS